MNLMTLLSFISAILEPQLGQWQKTTNLTSLPHERTTYKQNCRHKMSKNLLQHILSEKNNQQTACSQVSSGQSTLTFLKSIYSSSGKQHLKYRYCLACLDDEMLKLNRCKVISPATLIVTYY